MKPGGGSPALAPGARLGPYEIRGLLGAGGMGEVYRAFDPRLKRDVAVKVLPLEAAQDHDRVRRFQAEARAAGALGHPNVLAVYDVGLEGGVPYIVSELLEGETLAARLRKGPLTAAKTVELGLQITHGLAAAHGKGIVHRDLKPGNLFLTRGGPVKILDFGLAKLVPGGPAPDSGEVTLSRATSPGIVVGTAAYMSPEQARGDPVDHRSDIFSLGAVASEMLTGRAPFARETMAETLAAILREDPPDLPAGVPPGLDRVVQRCLEKDPTERFQSVRDVGFALETASAASGSHPSVSPASVPRGRWRRWALAAWLVAAAALGVIAFLSSARVARSPAPAYRQITFRRGTVHTARFAPDGQTVVYGASWEGGPPRVFTTRLGSPESLSLPLPASNLLAVSSTGEMALLLRPVPSGMRSTGTLARSPLSGGAPREIADGVEVADWAPDGSSLAVVRSVGGRPRIEFPPGRPLFEGNGWISHARVSPDGQRVAFLLHPGPDDAGSVVLVDSGGRARTLSEGWISAQGLAWHPDGREVWFTATREGASAAVHAVDLSGHERLVARVPGRLMLHDIGRDGRVLFGRESLRMVLMGQGPGEDRERNLSWFDMSMPTDISPDGTLVLFGEAGEAAGSAYALYLRKMDGSPAVRLGAEGALSGRFSPDGRWAAVVRVAPTAPLLLLPTGIGEARTLALHGLERLRTAAFFPDGNRLVYAAGAPGEGRRLYVQGLAGEAPRAVTPPGVRPISDLANPVSPDGEWVTAIEPDGTVALYPVNGGAPRPLRRLEPADRLVRWAVFGRVGYLFRYGELPTGIYEIDMASGARRLLRRIQPGDLAGIQTVHTVKLAADGRSYVYGCFQQLSELYVADGWR